MFIQLADNATALDKLAYGGMVMLIGMGIVFAVLIILWGVLAIFGRVAGAATGKASDKAQQAPAEAGPTATVSAEPEPVYTAYAVEDDEEELVAVFAAAISSMSGLKPGEFKVVNFKRTGRRIV